MEKIKIAEENILMLRRLLDENGVMVEGKLLDYIDTSDPDVQEYVDYCRGLYKEKIKRRLEISQELQEERKRAVKAMDDLQESNKRIQEYATESEKAKNVAVNDLQILTKKQHLEIMDKVVKFMIYSIVGGMIVLNLLFGIAIFKDIENQVLMTTWASIMTMVFTNAFSIVATIMGVKKIMQESKETGVTTTYEK